MGFGQFKPQNAILVNFQVRRGPKFDLMFRRKKLTLPQPISLIDRKKIATMVTKFFRTA